MQDFTRFIIANNYFAMKVRAVKLLIHHCRNQMNFYFDRICVATVAAIPPTLWIIPTRASGT